MNRVGILASAGLLLITLGCAPAREPPGIVIGRVVNRDKPITNALIYFEKIDDDYAVFESLAADGGFQLKTHDYGGLPAGSYRIAVRPDPGKSMALVGDAPTPRAHPLIPERFMDTKTSALSAEVKAGENPLYLFDLGK